MLYNVWVYPSSRRAGRAGLNRQIDCVNYFLSS